MVAINSWFTRKRTGVSLLWDVDLALIDLQPRHTPTSASMSHTTSLVENPTNDVCLLGHTQEPFLPEEKQCY